MTTDAAEGSRYFAADAKADDELARLKLLEAVCDPWTSDTSTVSVSGRDGVVWRSELALARWCAGFPSGWVALGGSSLAIWIQGFSAICARRAARLPGRTSPPGRAERAAVLRGDAHSV